MRAAAREIADGEDFTELIAGARALTPEAWDRLYGLAFVPLYRYIAARVGNAHDAEDLTEEVFTSALQSVQRLRANDEAGFFAWLFKIARFKIMDYLRMHYRHQHEPLPDGFDDIDQEPTPEEELALRVRDQELQSALLLLTQEQQEVLRLKFILECDNSTAGKILGKSPGAINQLQHRALVHLKRLLTK